MAKLFQRASPSTRPPAVAGRFYPENASALRTMIEGFLREAQPATATAPKAVIAPHAGYIYSGPIAASAFAQFAPAREVIKRVVLLGPSHRVLFRGLAATQARSWRTPLGEIPVDTAAVGQISSLPQVVVLEEAHTSEHSLEVELPFLQVVLAEFCIVPLVVGEAGDAEVAEVIDRLWGGEETRFVISSDLSHYHSYTNARELDSTTARAIETLRLQDIGEEQACGRIPIRGLLRAAHHHRLHAHTLDLRSSGDTAGPRDQVVGYGAFSFE